MYSLDDSGAIFQYHRTMIALHGEESTFALGWRDKASQIDRFETLMDIGELNGYSVLDAGCGYGDLRAYLDIRFRDVTYTGIEQIPELLDIAIQRYGHLPNTQFLSANFLHGELPQSDYVLASGSLNYRNADPEYIFKSIKRLYQSSIRGLGFNLLKSAVPHGFIVAYDINVITDYCKTLSPRVVLKEDNAGEGYALFLYR